MISFLTLVSHYMGMISVKSKLKNQVYTVMAFVGDWYLLYIAIRFLQNGGFLRGLLLLAAFLLFLYFSIMNIYYYFTTKKAPFDISPFLEKYIGGTPEEIREKEEFRQRLARVERQSRQTSSPSGFFDDQSLLPARLESNTTHQKNIQELAQQMTRAGMIFSDYGGRSDTEIRAQMDPDQTSVYAIGDEGVQLPYANIKLVNGEALVYAGLNQMNQVPVGKITRVGASSFANAQKENQLFLAHARLIGGEKKLIGRAGMIVENEPYQVDIDVAYKARDLTRI